MREAFVTAAITGEDNVDEVLNWYLSGNTSEGAELEYQWTQVSGTPVTLNVTGDELSFEAPMVDEDETLVFKLNGSKRELH